MEGTEEADNTAVEADTTSQATAGAEVPQTPTDETAAAADAMATTGAADGPESESTNGAAVIDDAAMGVAASDDAAPAATAVDDAASVANADAIATGDAVPAMADMADVAVTADPSPEAAVGSSGAEALGAADEVSGRVTDAVEPMHDAPAADDEGDTATEATGGTAQAEPAAAEAIEADVSDAPAAVEAPAVAPAAPAPRVYDGPEPTTMEELLNEQATEIRSLKHGDVVEGNVVRIDKDEILVDIGAKSEGVISNRELYGRNAEAQPQLNIGDQVLVYVLQPESPEGHAVLSLRRAGLERKWRAMQEQLDAGAIIEAPVIDHNKGGLIVDCGIRGFVPISQIVDFPRRPQNEQPRDAAQEIAEKLQPYVGRKLRLKILEVNRKANRLILSEKVALYEERREKRDELFSSLQVGQKVTGTVRSIAPFGVFIDLGGIDGLVHKSELSWNKVNNPEAGYRVGEEVEAEVIDINHERGRISLSIRRLQPDPWHSTVADLKVGDVIDGTVTKIVNFGAFVRVRDGLEGLIHISELSHARVAHPGDVVHEGQTIKLKIISLEQERHRLGLSLKQAEEAPARPERPATTGGRERRPRDRDRGYDMSQAVQEPEGGIDNTLAAAFAQVRAQMEETEAARAGAEPDEEQAAEASTAETAESSEPTSAETVEATAEVESPAEEAADEPAQAAETDDAPAAEVGKAEPAAKPTRRGKAKAAADEQPAADAVAEAPAEEPASAEEPAPAEDAAPAEADSTSEPVEASTDPSGEELTPAATDPAEGADDAAPAEGADKDETAG
jgi:small subunit ribosomal protein S1